MCRIKSQWYVGLYAWRTHYFGHSTAILLSRRRLLLLLFYSNPLNEESVHSRVSGCLCSLHCKWKRKAKITKFKVFAQSTVMNDAGSFRNESGHSESLTSLEKLSRLFLGRRGLVVKNWPNFPWVIVLRLAISTVASKKWQGGRVNIPSNGRWAMLSEPWPIRQ